MYVRPSILLFFLFPSIILFLITLKPYLQTVKEKYGSSYGSSASELSSTDSESAESEDEDGEELTATMDAAILRTLARIRRKDPAIYESGINVFGGTFHLFFLFSLGKRELM